MKCKKCQKHEIDSDSIGEGLCLYCQLRAEATRNGRPSAHVDVFERMAEKETYKRSRTLYAIRNAREDAE